MKQETSSKIEAILFAAGEPVGVARLSKFLKISKKDLEEEIKSLAERYEQDGSGLQIVENNNTIQLASNVEYSELVAKFLKKDLNEPLSKAALEVLSVIAYRGPVTRAQVEHIRGVNCSFTIRNLAIRGLIEREDNPTDSRSYLYRASGEFVKSLGLSNVGELPEFDALHEGLEKEEKEDSKNKTEEESDS